MTLFWNFAFCVNTFVRNFRLVLMILTLQLNKKPSSEMHFKRKVLTNSLIDFFLLWISHLAKLRPKDVPYVMPKDVPYQRSQDVEI